MLVTYYNTHETKYGTPRFKNKDLLSALLGKQTETKEVYDFQPKEFITMYISNSETVNKIYEENKSTMVDLTNEIYDFIKENEFTEETKHNFYTEFKIPKAKGGYRQLINPAPELKKLQRKLLDFIVDNLKILPHNASHAFIKNRDAITNAKVHQKSHYIVSLDIKDFFPSITTKILHNKLKNISLFSYDYQKVKNFLDALIFIATYKDCLPQGSPLSPYLSNLVMLDFDYEIDRAIGNKELQYYWYTRYADDMTFSSKTYHNHHQLILYVKQTLYSVFGDSLKLNDQKIKVLKNTGKCFITGAKLNKDNQITIGHEKKKQIKHELYNLFVAEINKEITYEQTTSTLGLMSYMHRIEPEYTKYLANKMLRKFNSKANSLAEHFKQYL